MSKILKSFAVTIDKDNVIHLDTPDFDSMFMTNIDEDDTPPVITEEEAASIADQIISQAKEQADTIINEANAKAREIVQELKEQAETEIEELKTNAHNEAAQRGKEEGQRQADIIIKEAEEIKANALIEKTETLNSAEPQIVELISRITKKLIGGAFELKPEIILYIVKQGLTATTLTGNITIHVSEDDYSAVCADKDELLAMAEAGCNIEIMKDLSLNAADCIIETKLGNIDCSLGQQHEALKENLFLICKNRFIEGAQDDLA